MKIFTERNIAVLFFIGVVALMAGLAVARADEPPPVLVPPPCGCICNEAHTQCVCEICDEWGNPVSLIWAKAN